MDRQFHIARNLSSILRMSQLVTDGRIRVRGSAGARVLRVVLDWPQRRTSPWLGVSGLDRED